MKRKSPDRRYRETEILYLFADNNFAVLPLSAICYYFSKVHTIRQVQFNVSGFYI